MKNFNNLITMTNVMRHNSQNAVNPDGQPTVNRQSRLMLRQGYLRNLAMILAVLVLSIGQMWGTSVTVGLTTSLSTTSKKGGTEVYSNGGNANLTVTQNAVGVGTGSDTIISYTTGDKALYVNSSTAQYANFNYNNKKGLTSLSVTRYAGYSVAVNSGYKYSLTAINATIAASANMTWKVDVVNSSGTVLYSSGSMTMTNYNKNTATNYTISVDLSKTAAVQNLTGTFYVRAYHANSSSGKFWCYPTLTITGNVESAAVSTDYYYRGSDNSFDATKMTTSAGGKYSYIASTSSTNKFKIALSASTWDYNHDYNWSGFCMTDQDINLGDFGGDDCYIWDAPSSYYIIIFHPNTNLNSSSNPHICVSRTLPDDTDAGLSVMKTIYLDPGKWATGGDCKYAIQYYAHNEDWSGYMTASPCFSGLYQVDIPAIYSNVIFVRLNPSGDISWDSKWNQTGDLESMPAGRPKFTIDLENSDWNSAYISSSKWTNTGISTYTIMYAGNGNTGGSMANVEGIACNGSTTLAANAFEKTGHTFANWKTNVAVTANGVAVAADGAVSNEAVISNITGNITLTAQWTPIPVSSITVSPDSKTLNVGDTQQLTATVSPDNAFDNAVTWSTSKGSVATVSSTGLVTAVAPGSCTITATAHDGSGVTATCAITVNKIAPNTYEFSADNTSICSGSNVTFTIANSQVGATYYVTKSNSGGSPIGESKAGTGSALSFTVSSAAAGDYYCFTTETTNYQAKKVSSSKVTISYKTATSISSQPNGIADATVGVEQTLSVTAAGTNLRYQWKESATEDGTYSNVASDGTSSSYSVTPDAAGTKWYKCVVTGDCGEATSNKVSIVAAAAATCTGEPTALVSGTLYKVEDMASACANALNGTGQQKYGLSSNGKFYVVGTTNDNNSSTGTVEMKTDVSLTDIGGDSDADFTNSAWLKMEGSTSHHSIKFVIPTGGGKLVVYGKGGGSTKGNVQIKENSTGTVTEVIAKGSTTACKSSEISVNAGTYYIYSSGASAALYGLKFVESACSTPAAPTAFSAGSITSTGATFSITDAANAASYDIYYSTSSSAPAASAAATTTSDSKTKAVTGLTANTTYYAWVRSVCDADHKSAWVALTSPTDKFTTSAAAALNDGCWDPANTAADKLKSGDVSLTPFESNFSGVAGITSVTIESKGTGNGQSAGSDDSSGYLKVKNASSSGVKIITIVTSTAKDITIGGQQYDSNTGSFYLVKSTAESTKLADCNTGATSKATNCPAGTYYVYAKGNSSKSINFSLLCIEDAAPDVTAPTFVSSIPANGATDVANSGTIVLTFNEPLGSVDATKFTLIGATKDAVSIDGSDAMKVNITYSGAANSATVTLATAAAAVSDVAGNALAAELSNISFTTAAAAPAGDCDELVVVTATSKTAVTATVGSVVSTSLSEGNSFSSIDGYTYAVKPGSSGALTLSPKDGSSFAAGDSLIFIVHNGNSGAKDEGFKIGSTSYVHSVAGKKLYYFRQVLTAANIVDGKVQIKRNSSDDRWVAAIIKHCGLLPSCTTPVLPTLTNKTVCEGGDADAAWNATITNSGSLVSGETVAYSWVKKGGSTPVSSVATYQPTDVTEAMAGTYVVTATVSADSKASSTATKEVTLTVNEATEVTAITADKATVYPTNSVTLTATANMDATWQWYTCTNAEGDGEDLISGATSASYTIASAGAAGTYYYKAKATGSCGIGSMVYTLTVSAAAGGDCFHYVSVLPDKDISPSSGASIVTPTYATTLEGGTMKVGSQQITITKNGLKLEGSKSVSITLESALGAGNVVIVKGTAATAGYGVTINGVNFYESGSKTFDVSYTVAAGDGLVGKTALTVTKYNGSSYLQEIKITGCGTACTDPEVTASVDNSTACVGSSVTFTATGAHAEANYQWQKYSGGAWTDIADAKAATYNITSVATTDALKYRVIAKHDCNRTSNEVTLSVPVAPVFGSFTATRSVMATQALSITDVEASDATSYAWYKSADATYDAGTDTKVGTTQELLLASGGEAAGATYYLFCVASNACGSTTSSAITVSVTALVEEDCSTRGNESDAEFGFQNSGCSQGTYNGTAVWSTGTSNSKILIYSAPDGKYFKTMKVTIASSSASKASYNWSTDGGSSYTADGVAITGVTTTLTEKTINLSAHGNVNEVKIGRNFGNGESSGTLYVSKICFEYTSACTATTVTPSTSSKTHTIGESFTKPTFTLGPAAVSSGTLTYSSSDEEIASVDESGNVTFNGTAGTVTITASYAGATIADVDYCASDGSYTITVSCGSESAPKIVAGSGTNLSGCNASVSLAVKDQSGNNFASGSYQWYRDGEEIDGATSATYTAERTGTYTVSHTGECTQMSTNSAVVTSESFDPSVKRLVPFQYYHADKTYTAQMKDRHLFAVTSGGDYEGKRYHMTATRNGDPLDISASTAFFVRTSIDNSVDTVMIDLNKLKNKFSAGDEIVLTCAAIADCGTISAVTENIELHVIDDTPTLALICSGTNKSAGTRKTSELTVGGDFLTGYNKADLCQQTGNTSFDANTEWGLYTELKAHYIVTPVNGYAVFNKLNYEPFDILLLTDYPKASKDDAAATVLDDMADLCDYRPMLSFKAHMVAKTPSKWAAKGFTTSPVVPKNTRTRLNIVCYAHPMFADMKTTATHIQKDNDDPSQIVYTMLTGGGYESSKGLQGFELEAAENFVVIGLTHYNATPTDGSPSAGLVTWAPGSEDRMLVTAVERQENLEARMIMFAVNCGAQSKFTETGRNVVLKCLEYLLDDNPLHVADCSFTFDNGAGNNMNAAEQEEACPSCTGTKGDGKWSTAANWGPDYVVRPGKDTEVKIAAPVTVDPAVGAGAATNFTPKVRSVRILEGGQVEIPAGSYLEVVSTIRRQNGNDIYPTEENDIHIGSSETGNGTLIFNNSSGDTKAHVGMYGKGFIDYTSNPKGDKNYQYMGVPCVDINAAYNYYGSWIYSWSDKGGGSYGWKKVVNGGIVTTWTGYCITQESATYYDISGTLAATGTVDIDVPAGQNMVVGNSWTAPIDLGTFTTTDFENMDANVYFFNTGIDKEGTGTVSENATGETRWAAGTYVTVPVLSAEYTGEDDHIPSLQGFFVKNTGGSAGTLHLDYDKHVRGSSRAGRLSGPLHAPVRRAALSSDEPVVLKMKVSGENYDDKLLLLEREDFTEGFDNGWDGDKWDGNESALYIYTTDNNGTENSVLAIPELEGTVIGFRAGEDDAYTLNFEYLNSDEPLYLYDVENNTYTQIMTGMTYRFFTTDNEKHERFIITRSNGQEVATGVESTSGSLDRSKAKKLLIEDKMFIMVNGMLYDATGKVVK